MKKSRRVFSRIISIVIIFMIGAFVGYSRRADLSKIIDDTPALNSASEWISKLGEKNNDDDKKVPVKKSQTATNATRTSANAETSSQTNTPGGSLFSSNKTSSPTKALSPTKAPSSNTSSKLSFSGEKIKVSVNGKSYTLRRDFKEAMDSYEKMMNDYMVMIKKMSMGSPEYLIKYAEIAEKADEFGDKMDAIEDDLTADELAYYIYVTMKIEQNVLSIMI